MRLLGKMITTATLLLLSTIAIADNNVFTCSSEDGRRHNCNAPNNGQIQFLRQRSQAACIAGKSYGFYRGGVWVTNGCRADFTTNYAYNRPYDNGGYHGGYVGGGSPIRYYGSYSNGVSTCSARNDQPRTFCSTYGALRNARPIEQNGACQRGRTWDVGPNGLWVSGGCSGKFQIIR